MSDRTDYTVEKINERVYRINEFNIMNCFLIIGDEKALLIDCGVGAGNMAEFIKTLTDKPVITAATHAHVDHVGAAYQFGKIYIHHRDIPILFNQTTKKSRRWYLKKHPSTEKFGLDYHNLPDQKAFLKVIPFGNNHKFDLGSVTVETIYTPGHSIGSVCFKIEEYKLIFVADNYIPMLSFKFDFGAPLTRWLKCAEEFSEYCNDYTLYGGHGQHPIDHDIIPVLIETVKKIISETKKNHSIFKKKVKTVEDKNGRVKVVYRTDMVL